MCSQKAFSKWKLAHRTLQGWRRKKKGSITAALAPATGAALDTVTSQMLRPKLELFEQILGEKKTLSPGSVEGNRFVGASLKTTLNTLLKPPQPCSDPE